MSGGASCKMSRRRGTFLQAAAAAAAAAKVYLLSSFAYLPGLLGAATRSPVGP